MSDEFEITNEIAERKREIVKAMTDVECYPAIIEEQICVAKYTKLPLSRVTTLGTAFEPLTAAFRNVINGGGTTSGLYQVTIPKGAHLAEFKNGSGYLGSVLKENGAVGGGQAVLNPLVFNPTMLFMATTLATIDKKLDNIQEMQRETLDFLVQKERSDLRGDLNFLTDVLSNYKYNWNNDKYIDSNYNSVLGIRQGAERKIELYRERITTKINKKSFFYWDQWVKKQLEEFYSEFKDYQLALYLYSFSSFLEVILLENFKPEYLDGISKKIEDYSLKYSELSTECYDQIKKYAQSSLQSKMHKGSISVSRGIGDNLAKDGDIKKIFGMTTVLISNKLEMKRSERTEQTMKNFKQFIEMQNDYIRPFVENINTVNKLYNQPIDLIFDKENIYIGTTEVQ
ncbi:hypothetical protein [Bacillus sp. AFS088145]|uniref:hypothetical protein n=1 Tax=Bacillus sp. AFS088145 TaxID=2033514 RepID=UPI000BF3AAC2|nr:hypothetical protein [Bacillus sp. AFS088145]PFH92634.1 hypothetical protein COI44_00140 [Bacillus sp. AFS088145]